MHLNRSTRGIAALKHCGFHLRAIRDECYKIWGDFHCAFSALYNLKDDLWEQDDLISSTRAEHGAALEKSARLLHRFPKPMRDHITRCVRQTGGM